MNEQETQFYSEAEREIDNFWNLVNRQHEAKYDYIIDLEDQIAKGWSEYDAMQTASQALRDRYNVMSQELWSADTYSWVEQIGEDLSDLAKEIERQEKKINNQLSAIHGWEPQLESLINDGPVEDLQAELTFRQSLVARLDG